MPVVCRKIADEEVTVCQASCEPVVRRRIQVLIVTWIGLRVIT